MKLHLESPYSDRIIEAMKKVLNYEDKYMHESCYCGLTVYEFVWDSTPPEYNFKQNMKDIALLAFGNDLPSTVHYMEMLRFHGDCDEEKCEKCERA